MIVDTSALVAILKGEDEAEVLARRILGRSTRMSAGSYVELMCVLARSRDPAVSRRADRLLVALGIDVIPVSVDQARLAAEAYRVYARGSGHPGRAERRGHVRLRAGGVRERSAPVHRRRLLGDGRARGAVTRRRPRPLRPAGCTATPSRPDPGQAP